MNVNPSLADSRRGESIDPLQAAPQRSSSENHRGATRYQCAPATMIKIFPVNREGHYLGWGVNLSRTGAGVLLNDRLPRKLKVCLQIAGPTPNQKNHFLARVVHCTRNLRRDEWTIGLKFEKPLSDDELDMLL